MNVEMLDRPGVEGVNKRLHDVVEETRKAQSKPGGITAEERAFLDGRIEELSRTLSNIARPQTIHVRAPLEAPSYMDRSFYNLTQLRTDEVGWSMHPTLRLLHEDLQRVNDELLVADLFMCGNGQTPYAQQSQNPVERMSTLRLWQEEWLPIVADIQRALGTGSGTTGGNWIPALMSSRLTDNVVPELRVAALFRQWDMPVKAYDLPFLGIDMQGYFVPEGSSIPASDPSTLKATLTAVKLAARGIASTEVDEDTAVALSPWFTEELGKAIGRALEDSCINGDVNVNTGSAQDVDMQSISFAATTTANGTTTLTTAGNFLTGGVKPGDVITGGTPAPPAGTVVVSITNATTLIMNNSITAGAEPQARTFSRPAPGLGFHNRKAWDGLRKKALISNMPNADLATFNDSTILPLWSSMGIYGVPPSDGAMIVGIKTFHKMIVASALGATVPPPTVSLVTMDRIPGIRPEVGQVGQYAGRPVILSEFVRENVSSTGVNDNSQAGNTLTFLLTVNRRAFVIGRRRGVTITRSIQFALDVDQVNYGGTWRGMFSELWPTAAAANKSVGIGRNFS